jgi:AcrR family transcriptional regulator
VFAERGFDGATAERIAQRAGATKAMINYHFRSKQGLYEAILLATFAELVGRLDAVRARGGSAPEQLGAFVDAFAEAATARPAFPAMMVREVLSGGRHLPAHVADRVMGVVGVVRAVVEQGVREGAFRKVDPLATHLSLVGALLFFFATAAFREGVIRARLGQPPPTAAAFAAHVKELMVRGLSSDAPARGRR